MDRRKDERRGSDKYRNARVVAIAVICSGILTLTISNFNEVSSDNRQAQRSRVNCESSNDDRRDTRDSLDFQSDQTLGDMTDKDGDPDEGTKPFDYAGTSFEKFKPIIVAQAKVNRARSRAWGKRIVDCNEVFPKRKTLGFIE